MPNQPTSGLTSGKVMVSRIVAPVKAISSRSMPIPIPPAGGMPTPRASRKSSSMSQPLRRRRASFGLGHETFTLHDRVVELGVAGSQLEAAHVEIPLLHHAGLGAVALDQRGRFLTGKSRTKVGSAKLVLVEVLPQVFDELAVVLHVVALHAELVGDGAQMLNGGAGMLRAAVRHDFRPMPRTANRTC